MVSALSAADSLMPPRTAIAPVRRKNRDSVMLSSVLIVTVHAGLFQDRRVLFEQPDHLRLAAGAIDERQRHGNLLLRQHVRDAIALGRVLQHELEAELLADADRGQQVVGAVAVEVNRALAFQHLDERFESDVAIGLDRALSGPAILVPLRLVLLRLLERLALQRGDLHSRERRLLLGSCRSPSGSRRWPS